MDFILLFTNLNYNVVMLVVFLFSWILLKGLKKPDKGQKPREAAGGWPIIGHLHLLSGPELPYITLGALADKYGPIFRIRIGLKPTLVVSSGVLAKELFTTNDVAVSSRPKFPIGDLMGYGYLHFGFAPYGAYWREIRKTTVLQLLSNRRIELLRHVRTSEVESSLKEIYKLWTKRGSDASHITVEMKQWFGNLNLNVTIRMIAGKRYCNAGVAVDEKQATHCIEAIREWFRLAGIFIVRDAIPFLGFLDLGGHEKAMKRTAKELDDIVEVWLEEHLYRKKADKEELDFMDVLLASLEGVDLGGLDVNTVTKATCVALLTGAADTIVVVFIWVLSLLLNNRPALEKVQEELDMHIGKERLVTESDLNQLEYLQAVVKESMRLYPAGGFSGPREFSEDCMVGGYHVPKGTRLLLNLWKMHRDPLVWSDPLKFKPERFLTTHKDVNVKGQNFELLPFGGGRRACPAISLGLQMTHFALASLLQAFEISTPANAPVDMTVSPGMSTMKATPLEIMFKPRLSSGTFDQLYDF